MPDPPINWEDMVRRRVGRLFVVLCAEPAQAAARRLWDADAMFRFQAGSVVEHLADATGDEEDDAGAE